MELLIFWFIAIVVVGGAFCIAFSNSSKRYKYPAPPKAFDSYTIGVIEKGSMTQMAGNPYLTIVYYVNGKPYKVVLKHNTKPSSLTLMMAMLGPRKATLIDNYRGPAMEGKEVYVYFNYNEPNDCYISPNLLSDMNAIKR